MLILCLISFPLSAFASSGLASVTTQDAIGLKPNSAYLVGTSTDDGTLQYGFQYGETTSYGTEVKSTNAFSKYLLTKELGITNQWGGADGQFSNPKDVAVGPNGNIYVVDQNNYRIQIFNSNGEYISQFNGYDGHNFESLQGIDIDTDGNLLVADRVLVKFDADGNWLQTFTLNGSLNYLSDVIVDHDGNYRVITQGQVYVISPADELVSTYISGEVYYPSAIAIDAQGNTYVSDQNSTKIVKYDNQNTFVQEISSPNYDDPGFINGPAGIAILNNGHIIVSSSYSNEIKEFDENGLFVAKLLSYNDGINSPQKISIDAKGDLYVANQYGQNIKIYQESDPVNKMFTLKAAELDCATLYHYRSFSTNGSGTAYGEDKSFTTANCAPGIETIAITPKSKSVNLAWDDVNNADEYRIAYRQKDTSTWTTKVADDITTTDIVGLTPETNYEFRISVVYSNDERGGWSPIQEATTIAQTHYNISTCDDLQNIGENRTTHQLGDFDGYYVLTNDIDCSDTANWTWDTLDAGPFQVEFGGFKPILDMQFMSQYANGFRGDLDGAGHKISHIHQSGSFVAGIIGVLQGGTVKDLVLDDMQISLSASQGIYGAIAATSDGPSVIDNVTVNGSIASVPQSGPIKAALNYPAAVDFDPDGNILILNRGDITRTDTDGIYLLTFATDNDIDFNGNNLVSDSDGNIYGVSNNANTILKLSSSGELLNSFRTDNMSYVSGLAVDSSDNIYASDGNTRTITKFDSDGNLVDTIQFAEDSEEQFYGMQGIAIKANGNLLVADNNQGIFEFDSDGNYLKKFAIYTDGNPEMGTQSVSRIAIASNGDILTLVNQRYIYRYSADGDFISSHDVGNGGSSSCNQSVFNVSVSPDGDIYVPCIYDDKVIVFDSSFNYKKTIGAGNGSNFDIYAIGGIVGAPGLISGGNENGSQSTVGGLSIINTQSNVDINLLSRGNSETTVLVGGIVGYGVDPKIKIYQTSSTGTISSNSTNPILTLVAGGIGGILNAADVKDSYTQSAINISGDYGMEITGGIAGQALTASIENVYSSGDITSTAIAHGDGRMISGGATYVMNVNDHNDSLANPDINVGLRNSFVTSKVNDGRTGSPQSSIQDIDFSQIPTGAVGGMIYGANGDFFKNNAFDVTSTGLNQCAGIGLDLQTEDVYNFTDADCKRVNENGDQSNYFFGNSTNGPLASWDFENVWQTNAGGLPTLRGTAQVAPPVDGGGDGTDLPPDVVDNGNSDGQSGGSGSVKSFSDLVKKKVTTAAVPDAKTETPTAAITEFPTQEKMARVLGETGDKPKRLEAIGKVKAGGSHNMFPIFVSGMCGLSVLAYAGWFLISRRKNKYVDDTIGPYGY